MGFSTTAAVLHEAGGAFSFETIELDDLRSDEVLVRIQASGVCHTDIGAQALVEMPALLGHEGTGVVERVGAGVTRVKPGDTVIISYGHCGACPNCDAGRIYVCDNSVRGNFGGRRYDGSPTVRLGGEPISGAFFQQSSFAQHAITLERDVVVDTFGLTPELRAALPCGVITGAGAVLNSMRIAAGESLVVFGAGAVGLSAVMAARVAGAGPIIAVDLNRDRLELALSLGATQALSPEDGDVVAGIREWCPRGADFSFETTGNDQALESAIEVLAMAGECGMVTAPHYGEKYPFTPFGIFVRAAVLRGIFFGSAVPATFIPKLVTLHREGRFPYDALIGTYPFDEIDRAFADTAAGQVVKPVLRMSA